VGKDYRPYFLTLIGRQGKQLSAVNINVKASLTHKNIQVNWLNRLEDIGSGPFFYKTEL